MKNLTVSDVMTRGVLTARAGTPVKELARIMVEHRVSALPVLDDDDRLIGVVSEADVILKQGHQIPRRPHWWEPMEQRDAVRRAAGDTAGRLMSTAPVSIATGSSIPQAARLMADHGVKRLPVVDAQDRVVGVVSRHDLLKAFVRSDDDIRADVLGEVFVHLLWDDPTEVDVQVRDGVVEMVGTVDRRSTAEAAERLVRRLDGVVDVVANLGFRVDDRGLARRR
ncbi:CBS domain-containing protein [Pseudonocardia lacus]|uniref:CBS domain-containing protein n=1 Tax=Pseudonocardia lacus TaxID=2835865 RepID=UPI001BDC371E|nr:CBS domain-containing protein [Pseudonocardia lacus]